MLSNKCITADNFKKLLQRIKHDITDPAVATSNTAMTHAATAKEVAEGIDAKATDAVNKANIAVVTANNAAEYATQAAESASNAETYAATAKEVAEGIDSKATHAMEDAATAKEVAEGIDAKATQAMEDAATAKDFYNKLPDVYYNKSEVDEKLSEVKAPFSFDVSTATLTITTHDERFSFDESTATLTITTN